MPQSFPPRRGSRQTPRSRSDYSDPHSFHPQDNLCTCPGKQANKRARSSSVSHEWAGGWARERVESYRLGVAKWTRGNPHAVSVIPTSYALVKRRRALLATDGCGRVGAVLEFDGELGWSGIQGSTRGTNLDNERWKWCIERIAQATSRTWSTAGPCTVKMTCNR